MAHLPVELLDTIIGYDRDDRYILKSYSLVCRAWRFRAQAIIWSDVTLGISYPRIHPDRIFGPSPHLASAIRSITLKWGALDDIAKLNILVLPNVMSLTLERIDTYNPEKQQPARAAFELLRTMCPAATALVLRRADFRTFRECFAGVFAFAPLDLRFELVTWPMDQCDIPDYALAAPPLAFRTLGITSTIDDEFYTFLNRRGGIDLTTVERLEYSELESPWSNNERTTPVPELIKCCVQLRSMRLYFKDKDTREPDPARAFLPTIDFAANPRMRSLTVVVDYRQMLAEYATFVTVLSERLRSFPAPGGLIVKLDMHSMSGYRIHRPEWEEFAEAWRACCCGLPATLNGLVLTLRGKDMHLPEPIIALNDEMQRYNIVINVQSM